MEPRYPVASSGITLIEFREALKVNWAHHGQTDLNKKSGKMHQTLILCNIDAQGFRKTKNENPPTWEREVPS